MDWLTFISTLVTVLVGSGLISLFTIRETRKGMKLDNKEKELDTNIKLIDELQDQIEKLNDRLDQKDHRITELEDSNSTLRVENGDLKVELMKATLLKCDRIECNDRKPPFGYRNIDLDS